MKNIVEVKGLQKKFFSRNNVIHAIDNVSFDLKKGQIIGLIGESGSGKTTIGRTLMNLYVPDAGSIMIDGHEYGGKISKKQRKHLYNDVQMIFQDPYSSLNGQKNIYSILRESLIVKQKDKELLSNLLEDRLETLKYYRGTLNEYFWKKYWNYRVGANKVALVSYKGIKKNLQSLKLDHKKTSLENYLLIREAFFEEKFNANSKILNSIIEIAFSVRKRYEKLRSSMRSGSFKDFDEVALKKAQSKVLDIEREIKESIELQKINQEIDKVNLKIQQLDNSSKELKTHTKNNVRSLLRSITREKRVLFKLRLVTTNADEYDYINYLRSIKGAVRSILFSLKKLSFTKEIYFAELNHHIDKIQKEIIDIYNFQEMTKGQFSKIKSGIIRNYKKYLVNLSDTNLNEMYSKMNKLMDKKYSLVNKRTFEKNVSARRDLKGLQEKLFLAEKKLFDAINVNNSEIAKYKADAEKREIALKDKNEIIAKKSTSEIKKMRKDFDYTLNKLMKAIFHDKFKHNEDFKSRRGELRHIRRLFQQDKRRNNVLDSQIRKNFNEIKSVKTFISVDSSETKKLSFIKKRLLKRILVRSKVFETLNLVGLPISNAFRYPHEFSGGMRQRVGIGRAIISEPKIIIADEPIAALDLSIQAQIINLLNEIIRKKHLSMIFIAHDLSMIEYNSNALLIMHQGKVLEYGSTKQIFKKPAHPYTKNLIESMPSLNKVGKGFSSKKFDLNYKKEYSLFNSPEYYKLSRNHFVLGLEKQIKKWTK